MKYHIPKPFSHNHNADTVTSGSQIRSLTIAFFVGLCGFFLFGLFLAEISVFVISLEDEKKIFRTDTWLEDEGGVMNDIGTGQQREGDHVAQDDMLDQIVTDRVHRDVKNFLSKNSSGKYLIPQFEVIVSDEENAFAILGGDILVTTTLINNVGSFEELLFILEHERSHVSRRHVLRGFVRVLPLAFVSLLLGDTHIDGLIERGNVLFSRGYESQADRDAVVVMRDMGRNPTCAQAFFVRDQEEGTDRGWLFQFFSTHPSSSSRIEYLQSQAGSGKCTVAPLSRGSGDDILF